VLWIKNKNMTEKLFLDFEKISSKQWKQLIQFELKGADYNESLVWESLEGIKVKPFYQSDEDGISNPIQHPNGFSIVQPIYVFDVDKSNIRALESLKRGAESLFFTLPSNTIKPEKLLQNIPLDKTVVFLSCTFLDVEFIKSYHTFGKLNHAIFYFLNDPIGQLMTEGNWFENLPSDMERMKSFQKHSIENYVSINTLMTQNAGANMVQQLAYSLAHLNEYDHHLEKFPKNIVFQVAVGGNYFFEIAKIRALRWLVESYFTSMGIDSNILILTTPSRRNKTIYDYNINMLRTTTECMSAILGGSDFVMNQPYDHLYHKDNEFGDRMARNQLLILKNESYFNEVHNAAEGSYYIESLTKQLAEKALELFKDIEKNGGLITQLMEGTIQRKVEESAEKEQQLFENKKEILLGTNKYPNPKDLMKNDLELFPFVKTQPRKTLIKPIIAKRWAEQLEQERLEQES